MAAIPAESEPTQIMDVGLEMMATEADTVNQEQASPPEEPDPKRQKMDEPEEPLEGHGAAQP